MKQNIQNCTESFSIVKGIKIYTEGTLSFSFYTVPIVGINMTITVHYILINLISELHFK